MLTSKGDEIILDYNAISYDFALGFDTRGFLAPSTARMMGLPNVQPPHESVAADSMLDGALASMAFLEKSQMPPGLLEILYPSNRIIRKKSLAKVGADLCIHGMVAALLREFLPVTKDFPLERWEAERELAEQLTEYIFAQLTEVVELVDKPGNLPAKPFLMGEPKDL